MEVLSVVEFVPYPGGRYRKDGPYSGEEFRENILKPRLTSALRAGERLHVKLDGAPGYGSSFLEEAFGGLVRSGEFTSEQILGCLHIIAANRLYEPYKRLVEKYVSLAGNQKRGS